MTQINAAAFAADTINPMGIMRGNWLKELFVDVPTRGTGGVLPLQAHFDASPVLVAFATQTGAAEAMAEATLEQLQMAGVEAQLVDFYDMSVPLLQQQSQLLVIASTTFDGDPPDMAEAFCQEAMGAPAELSHLHFGLLGLGDRAYETFCGFGHRLNDWLRISGARPWFDMIEVDDEDEAAVEQWHANIAHLLAGAISASPA